MINLTWNTRGRVGLAEYNKARWRHFAFCLIPFLIFIGSGFIFTTLPLWAGISLMSVAAILLFYYRYRFMQVMVRRLHDRNMSGKLLILSPVILLIILAGFGIALFGAVAGSAVPTWLSEDSSNLWIWIFLIPSIGFNLFLRYQLSQAGTATPNRYGLPPGVNNAAAVF